MKRFCESLISEHTIKTINSEKKKMLTNKEHKSYLKTNCHTCKKKFEDKYINDKKYCRVRYLCHHKCKYRGNT